METDFGKAVWGTFGNVVLVNTVLLGSFSVELDGPVHDLVSFELFSFLPVSRRG